MPNYPILVSISPYIKNYGKGDLFIYSRTSTHLQCVSHIPTHRGNQAWIQAHIFYKYLWHTVADEDLGSKWKTGTDKHTLSNNVALSLCNSHLPRILYLSENDNRVQKWNVGYYLSLSHVYTPAIVSRDLHLHAA